MKKTMLLLSVLLVCFCSKKDEGPVYTVPDYRGWRRPIPEVLDYPVPGHGAGQRIIYGNDLSFSPEKETKNGRVFYTYPDGTVIIKEVFKPGENINTAEPALTIMVKDPADPLSRDGWLYYMKPPGGEPVQIRGKMCSECHSAANESFPYFDRNIREDFRDYIFAPFF